MLERKQRTSPQINADQRRPKESRECKADAAVPPLQVSLRSVRPEGLTSSCSFRASGAALFQTQPVTMDPQQPRMDAVQGVHFCKALTEFRYILFPLFPT